MRHRLFMTCLQGAFTVSLNGHLCDMLVQPYPASGVASNTYICLLGVLTACWSLIGYDASAHMIEETVSAEAIAGYPMLLAIGGSFLTGLVLILTLTLCLQARLECMLMSVLLTPKC